MNTVNGNSIQMAANPNNVRFVTGNDHYLIHDAAGGYRAPISGQPLLNISLNGRLPSLPGRNSIEHYKLVALGFIDGMAYRLDLVDPETFFSTIAEDALIGFDTISEPPLTPI